ncbi:sulfurtransferase [Cutibacterium sp. WCA-380-WT-3A]|uniref:Sulfurtransferase n=1 Tax=Cutibacterium porci TaxID=2605781 RepID=A0A7K0J8G3_9ACTN|nr:rhodanese-like domain-containing protein [Cutibacterium porci]MSS46241.1 sulfurtransferase [Cutibacterium porci]
MAETLCPTPVVDPKTLAELVDGPDADRIIIVDVSPCRPGVPHIPHALPFDLDGSMSDQSSSLPHTMPSLLQFQNRLRKLGVNNDSHVIVTEDDFLFASARPWWMMHACGFNNASVLEGGNAGWVAAGGRLTTDITPAPEPGTVTLTALPGAIIDRDEVLRIIAANDDPTTPRIVDARSAERFAGKVAEPRTGLRSGHMPTATNLPYTDIIADGRIRPVEELRQLIDGAAGDRPIVATCGSGVTACIIALAATLVGREDIGIYDGSWSEWARPGNTPVVTDA